MTRNKPPLPATLPATVAEAFPVAHLVSEDIPPGGLAVVISRVAWDHFDPKGKGEWELKAKVFFANGGGKEGKKFLILNKTQAESIATCAGTEEIARWPGTRVRLARAVTPNKKLTIAIAPAPPPAETPTPAPSAPEEKPF